MYLGQLYTSKMLLMKGCQVPVNKPDRVKYLFIQGKPELSFPPHMKYCKCTFLFLLTVT